MEYAHAMSGRNPRSVAVLVLLYSGILMALTYLEAAPWLMAIVVLITLPAVFDIAVNRRAGLTLDGARLAWFSGDTADEVALNQIRNVRFDTRLDLSVRVTVILLDGRKIRLPYDSLPPHRAFEKELVDQRVATERHHFNLV